MKDLKEIQRQRIIVDTNILIHCGTEHLGESFRCVLRDLTNADNFLAISAISGFEILKKFHNDHDVIDYYLKLLKYIKNLEVDKSLFEFAGKYANALFEHSGESFKKDNDCVIATTAIQKNAMLLTANRKDFPKPYWVVEARRHINWEDSVSEKVKTENVFLLSFNKDKILSKMKAVEKKTLTNSTT